LDYFYKNIFGKGKNKNGHLEQFRFLAWRFQPDVESIRLRPHINSHLRVRTLVHFGMPRNVRQKGHLPRSSIKNASKEKIIQGGVKFSNVKA
jgi:hypothetical protein